MTTPPFPNTGNRYYNPVSKIQSLIQNLDAELVQLCKQCSVPKPTTTGASVSSHSHGSSGNGSLSANRNNFLLPVTHPPRPQAIVSGHSQNSSPDVSKRQLRNIYRTRVIDAYRSRRIFTVFGNYHTIRRALMRRGWIEKLPPGRYSKLQNVSEDTLLENARRGNEYEAVLLSRMISHFPAFFIWQTKAQRDMCADVHPYRNRVRRAACMDFSTKVGLVGIADQERWFREDGVCGMSYPRFYRIGSNSIEERIAFIEDFQNTQARSLLRFIKEQPPDKLIDPESGNFTTTILDFALQKVKNMIREVEHFSLDDSRNKQQSPTEVVENQTFMINSREIMRGNARIKTNEKVMTEYARLASQYLAEIEQVRPDYRWDGCRNLWILKPGFQSRGIGIVIRSSLDEILQWSTNNQNRRYIVQKYIERPLLVFRTKFDIRQYMLLTIGGSKVTIWMYRDCYLRFSSQEFTLDDLRESIHLTNNSVQKRYRNKQTRDTRLPRHNMWSLEQFKTHLKNINAPEDAWSRVYNGFKQNLIAVVLASMDETNLVENAFELYGCDFMVDEHYNPILIEINSTPDLSPSTEVTARICPNALRDLVKVIVDLPKTPHCTTGLFENVYEINYNLSQNPKEAITLELSGKAMTLHEVEKKQTPPRTKFIKRIIRTVNKTASSITNRKDSPREKITVKKKLKDRSKSKSSKASKASTPASTPSSTGAETVNETIATGISKVKLDSVAKENLALKYTKVKW